ncbi:MAG: MATE family efflux transporter [Clostridiales bacterium]|nr:MATE family efflux transporter [Clostridiales bacterium]
MSNGATLMTEGPVWKHIVKFAVPVFWGNLFQQLYNVVDTLVVGNCLDSNALAAVSSSGNIIFLMVGLFSGLFTGAGAVISGYFGARDQQNMSKAIHTTVAFGLVSGVVLSVAGVFLSPVLLRWIGTPASVFPKSVEYFRVYFAGVIFVVLYNTAAGIFQTVGDSRHPLYFLIVSSVVNVVLDLVFVAGLGMGVGGAALATVISQAVSAGLGFYRLFTTDEVFRVWPKKIRFHGKMLRRLLVMGIPAGLQNSIISIGNIFVQSGINRYDAMAVAGSGAYSKIEGFGFLPVNAFIMALTVFTAQNLGAKEMDRVKKGSRFGIVSCMIMAETIALLVYAFAPVLIGLFNGEADVVKIGTIHARTVTPFFFLLAFSHSVAAILRGAGKAVVPMVVMGVCWCAVRIVYISFVTPMFDSIRAVFMVYPITWTLSSIVFLIYYLKGNWKNSTLTD